MLVVLLLAAPARASEANTIIERCANGQSLSGFSQRGYREALKQLPTVASEYSACAQEIRAAELAALGGGAGQASGSKTAIPLTPAEQQQVIQAHRHGSAPVRVGAHQVQPGVVHANVASVTSTLPTSLQAVLALLLAGGAALAAEEIYKRVRPGPHR
jgi:hypothetical protein